MSEDKEPHDILDSGTEIPLLGPGWTITITHEGIINVSMALSDQTKKNRRMRLVDACRLHLTEEGKVAKFSAQGGVDATENVNID